MIGQDIYFFLGVCNKREITIGTISKEIYLKNNVNIDILVVRVLMARFSRLESHGGLQNHLFPDILPRSLYFIKCLESNNTVIFVFEILYLKYRYDETEGC